MHADPAAALRFGIFTAPIHSPSGNPTLQLQRDLELVVHAERIGFDEMWFGEHHSTGYEIVGSPEIIIAAAAERTKRIRLGTGVVSLPYHHPLIVADRISLLDHLTGGRLIFGVGHGSLAQDAYMMGVDESTRRAHWAAAYEAITALLRGEVVTTENEWFTLREARCHLLPYQRDLEIAVASAYTPTGARMAGATGASLLTLSPPTASTAEALAGYWKDYVEEAARHGITADPQRWRILTGIIHLAETVEQAKEDVRKGLTEWLKYVYQFSPHLIDLVAAGADDPKEILDGMIACGFAVVGTPDDAIARVRHLVDATGGFGTYLIWDSDIAAPAAKLRSYELFAEYVIPALRGTAQRRLDAAQWGASRREQLDVEVRAARDRARAT